MIVDKIYCKYKYRGSWFVIARLKFENEYVTRPIQVSENIAKTIKVGDIL